ncbi:RNA polymerase II-associated protein 3 [Engraulis encrasicolus]|uniref:RNA polymerase II-associated protein 3 n=1 Tax=Engraulis encrasicolus TaxID=184585 RepID=UPI002FD26771
MSNGSKAIELQMQMRQNTEDLHNFMRELDSWESDIKKKDEQLRSGDSGDSSKTIPPIRNKDFKKKRRPKSKIPGKEASSEDKQPRIKSYDYNAWEKFDVDKALESMEKEDSPEESNESDAEDVTPELPPLNFKTDQEGALAQKEKGNQFFKEGKYDEAMQCYSRGMDLDPYNPVLPTNRAACFFKLKKYAVAEADCNMAIVMDKKYMKAFARRGAARFALKKYQLALEDYKMVLNLDPGNLEAENELKKVKEALEQAGGSPKEVETKPEAETAVVEDPGVQKRLEEQKRKQEAVLHKDRGNAYFKEGKYEAAVECYSSGMEADGTNLLLPANRAMAYLKLERYAEAEQDCSRAIDLDGTYSKAFARRGTARAALGKLAEAKEDFEEVLKLEPGNKQAVNEINKIKMDINAGRTSTGADSQRRVIQPINKPPHLLSTKPLRRIEIEEIEGDIAPATEGSLSKAGGSTISLEPGVSAKAGPTEHKTEAPVSKAGGSSISVKPQVSVLAGPSTSKSQDSLSKAGHTETKTQGSLSKSGGAVSLEPLATAKTGPSESKAEGKGSALDSSPSAKIQKIEELPASISQPPTKGPEGDCIEAEKTKQTTTRKKKSTDATSATASEQVSPGPQESDADSPPPPPPPANSFQLEADLRKIGKKPQVIYKYLKQIEPEMYARIFQNSLEPEILNQILKILQNYYIKNEKPELILAILKNLASVRRFDMAVMFMSSKEKKVIQDLFEAVRLAGLKDASVHDLQKKYGV